MVQVEVDGEAYRAATNNTGRLEQFLVAGREAFCQRSRSGSRTDFRLFAIRDGPAGALVDTALQMKAFEQAVETGLIPWLEGYRLLRRNARLGESVIDYLFDCGGEKVYLECKSAVFREGRAAMYPDCPTPRGRRHIGELVRYVRNGGEALIVFIAALPDVGVFKPYRAGDPELAELLVEAHRVGVGLRAISMQYRPEDSFVCLIGADLPVELGLAITSQQR